MKPRRPSTAYLGIALALGLGPTSQLLLLVFLFLGSLHFIRLDLGPTAALAWNATLSMAFFLQHSGMVRRSFRRRLEGVVAEPFHGLIYTIASGSVLILCLALWQRIGEPVILVEGPSRWVLRAVFLLTLPGFAWGVRALGSFDTFGVRPVVVSLRGGRIREAPFVVKGPYRWARHPLYLFVLVLIWSCPVVTPDRLLFNFLWTAWIVIGTVLEERDLVAHFGEAYVRYQREVPMIVPGYLPGLILMVAIVGLPFLTHYAPFDPASYGAWVGIVLFPVALVALAKPMRILLIRSRRQALFLLLLFAGLTLGALLWPASIVEARGPQTRLDEFLPRYEFREYHETRVRAPMDRVVAAVREVSFADMPVAVMLMRIRDIFGGPVDQDSYGGAILDLLDQPASGFLPLDTGDPREVVYGMAGRPWTSEPAPPVTTPDEFLAFDTAGHIRVAFNIRCTDEGDGIVRVSTETRILGNDPEGRRIFQRYWRIIYPGSAIIRRIWLDAIVARARDRSVP